MEAAKSQRVLACILCQQRKIKCDRKFPCSNCTKSRSQCVPATLAPRRRRRRYPERELLSRLRHYEDLLRRHNIDFESLQQDPIEDKEFPDVHINYGSDNEQSPATRADLSSPSNISQSEKVYEAKSFWHAMNQGFGDVDNDSDSSQDGVQEAMTKETWDQTIASYKYNGHLLFGSQKAFVDPSTLQPDTVHIFRLWQIYLDNVNPLLKVTHTPSLQGRIIESASNIANISPNLEALMFSIYCMSILSLAAEDCQTVFGASQRDLLTKFQFGCEQALLKCDFLKTSNRDCLTALYLYLLSARPSTDPRSMSSLLGIAIRIAQRMGIHSETTNCTYGNLEAEIRRRLWWSLILFDARIGEMVDYKTASLLPTWDCKTPLNVNDSELRPEMKVPPLSQNRPTEALFAVVRSEMGEFIRHSSFHLEFTNPALKPVDKIKQHGSSSEKSQIAEIEQLIQEKYLRFCDEEDPLHFVTIWTVRGHLARCRLVEFYSQCSKLAAHPTEAQRDGALSYALTMIECDTKIMSSQLTGGYLWVADFNFPALAYIQIVQDLRRRPTSEQSTRAWEVMNENYETRFASPQKDDSLFIQLFSKMVLEAWEAQEAAFMQSDKPLPPPRMVSCIKHTLASGRNIPHDAAAVVQNGAHPIHEGTEDAAVSMSIDGHILSNGLGGYFDYTASLPGPNLNMPAQPPLDINMNQLNWHHFGWGLGRPPGW